MSADERVASMQNLMDLDAVAQAGLVARGDVTPTELVEAAAARIEALNPRLNAVVVDLLDHGLASAHSGELPDGPFRGVPFLLKDIGACQAGLPQYRGMRVLREIGWRCPRDTPLGARFREAGFVVVGKTNTPELGLLPFTQPYSFGPTRNPWDLDYSPSGSSGGAAAAVASGMVAVAHASDGAGSIRMPAAWSGLVGLKPSRGRTSPAPMTSRNAAEHVLTRSVRDTAAVLDAVHGPEPGDLYLAPAPAASFASRLDTEPEPLRVALVTGVDASGVDTHPECAAAARAAAETLGQLGHDVVERRAGFLFDDVFVDRMERELACRIRRALTAMEEAHGVPFGADEVEPWTWALSERGRGVTAEAFLALAEWQQEYAVRMARWWEDVDLLVTPATAVPPMTIEDVALASRDPERLAQLVRRCWCFAAPFNLTGQPAVSLPLSTTRTKLPIGVQVVAGFGREELLLRVARSLELAAPWERWMMPEGVGRGVGS
ncbi:MAG TPA: amidase [Actinomycetota bacterium]|nr:amidase [Actinomycetota bacterium]